MNQDFCKVRPSWPVWSNNNLLSCVKLFDTILEIGILSDFHNRKQSCHQSQTIQKSSEGTKNLELLLLDKLLVILDWKPPPRPPDQIE